MKRFYEDRGFTAPWTANGALDLTPMPAHETDNAKRMLWLKTSVRPMIERLKTWYTVHEIREAVGLLYDPKRERQ